MDAVRLAEDDRYVIETGRSLVNIERKLRTAGTFGMRWYSTSKAPIRDSTGEVTGLVGISRDITPSKIAAETLTKTASDLRAINAELLAERRRREHQQSQITMLLNASHEGVLLFVSDGRVTWLNDALGHLFGVDRETIRLGDHIDNVREQARSIIRNPEKFFVIVDSGGVDGKSEASGEVEIQGTERHLAFYAVVVGDSTDDDVGRLWVFRDISKQREVEQLKETFLSSVSHELRTPLTSIKGFTSLLLAGKAGSLSR